MKILLTLFVLFLSPSVFSLEWNFEFLDTLFLGCIDEAKIDGFDLHVKGINYEYCGCYTNGIAKNFEVLEVVKLNESGMLESNKTFNSIVIECLEKVGY